MRYEGSDQVGRWPWGVWLALVGVSAGTVASFAAVGWAFLSAAGAYDAGTDSAAPPGWVQDDVVIEAEPTPEPGAVATGPEPTTEASSVPEPEVEPAEPETREPVLAPVPERAPAEPDEPEDPTESESDPPKLVPIEEEDACELTELLPSPDWNEGDSSYVGSQLDDALEQVNTWRSRTMG